MNKDSLYTLIPIETFKSFMGVDDRDDKIVRFCLVTSSLTIEQYCMRKFLRKKYFECIEYNGDLILPLKEYPVKNILAAYSINCEQLRMNNGELIEPEFYRVIPDCGTEIDLPCAIELSPALQRYRGLAAIKVIYWAGYKPYEIPADLSAACMELASWNFNRYKGRRVGMSGNIRGSGKDGEHFEMSMPENVKALLEPYRRKVI